MYWQQAADCRNLVATNFMTRDRFDEIMCYFQLADNNQLNKEDKFAKLRPRFDNLNRSFLARFCSETRLSIDESMVPYFGHHGCKQFIRGKPIRFGYKIWCLNTTLGYPIQFQAYQGKGSVTRPELGLGGGLGCAGSDQGPSGGTEVQTVFRQLLYLTPPARQLDGTRCRSCWYAVLKPHRPMSTDTTKSEEEGSWPHRPPLRQAWKSRR